MDGQLPPGASPVETKPAILFLLWGAFVSATFVYAGVACILNSLSLNAGHVSFPPIYFVAGLSAMSLAGWFFFQNLNPAYQMEVIQEEQQTASGYLGRVQLRMIVQSAFYEAIAIYALVGLMLGLPLAQAIGFMAFSTILLLTIFPGLRASAARYWEMRENEVGR